MSGENCRLKKFQAADAKAYENAHACLLEREKRTKIPHRVVFIESQSYYRVVPDDYCRNQAIYPEVNGETSEETLQNRLFAQECAEALTRINPRLHCSAGMHLNKDDIAYYKRTMEEETEAVLFKGYQVICRSRSEVMKARVKNKKQL